VNAALARRQARLGRIGVPASRLLLPGTVTLYLSVLVLLPLAAVVWKATGGGLSAFWQAVSDPGAVAALELTLLGSLAVVAINAVTGTVIAWVLVRDSFPGKGLLNATIDLPFALPTIVAGVVILTLYGPQSPLGINITYTRAAVLLAFLFVTLPFVVRSLQPVLLELDREMEEAAATLGAGQITIFRRIILPTLLPALLSGLALGFARSMGEFGAVVLITGNIPFKTEVASVHIYTLIESDNAAGAAALSVVLLTISLLVLLSISLIERWGRKHDR
jgi:sulfate transport system permease protein